MKLVLIRHGESIWNKENLFTGWTDVDLDAEGVSEATKAGDTLREQGFDFDICYTSYLKRAINTLNIILTRLDREWLPVYKSWKLNERHYGALQGLNKSAIAEQYGEEQLELWRRSFDTRPPALEESDERNPKFATPYRNEDPSLLPLTESLKDTFDRVVPYFNEVIKRDMENRKHVLVAAHGNSLRALVKHLENISDQDIVEVEIPVGVPLVYEFDDSMNFIKKYYLGQ
ncbi:2,3-diphosphoglycerate-dependent phosphoglycerate mutase [Candidatus Saccharibacteria bacterium]|nr:2,3-diphosphoglycerate-dependent phosphoglycerate mutase [Candidatus Saccharibacteria bacterium]